MQPKTLCCELCFEHPWLQEQSRIHAEESGICFYCGSINNLAHTSHFSAGFRNLLTEYIPAKDANGGRDSHFASIPILEAINRDWNVFSARVSQDRSNLFLQTVLENSEPPYWWNINTLVVPFHRNAYSTIYYKWLPFFSIEGEFFSNWPEHMIPEDIETPGTFVWQAASHLKTFISVQPAGKRFWRARGDYHGPSQWHCRPLPLAQMRNNPTCPSSRLNRTGEAVLYCAEAEKTALAEIRPGRGCISTTCELVLNRDVRVLDLAAQLTKLNPFTTPDLSGQLDLQRVARNLSVQVAQPTSRGEDPAVYGKTQCLAMIVRAMKLDGVRFSSALDVPKGVNLALFDTASVVLSNPRLVSVTKTDLTFEGIDSRTPNTRWGGPLS